MSYLTHVQRAEQIVNSEPIVITDKALAKAQVHATLALNETLSDVLDMLRPQRRTPGAVETTGVQPTEAL